MGAVRNLDLSERVHVDGGFLVEVMAQLGPVAARDLINEALGTVAVELRAIAGFRSGLEEEPVSSADGEAGDADAGADGGTEGVGEGTGAVAAPLHLADLVLGCDRLSRIAWELGLTTLSGVAVDLGFCAERGDLVALRAVEARLQRVGRGSLCAAWAEAAV